MRIALAALVTLGNALCGFAGIVVLATDGSRGITVAAIAIFAAWLFDVCDGPIARRLGARSDFGAVLDSLCDAVSFGILPAALVVTAWREAHLAAGIAIGGAYLAGALLRLARYTAHALAAPSPGIRWWFAGLPSPVAAMSVAAVALWSTSPLPLAIVAGVAGPLMISPVPYSDLVAVYARRRLPAWTLLLPVAAAVAFDWRLVLVIAFAVYVASGAATALLRARLGIVAR